MHRRLEDLKAENQRLRVAVDRAEEAQRHLEQRALSAEEQSHQLRLLSRQLSEAEQRERQRLAEVLHDHLQQLLVVAKMKIDSARRHVTEDGPAQAMAKAVEYLDECVEESRSLSAALNPTVLREQGLVAALYWLAAENSRRYDLKMEVQATTLPAAASAAEQALLFQAVRELLFNVVKHAGTNVAHVQLHPLDENRVELVVEDHGRGCEPRLLLDGEAGFGLMNIRQRVTGLGGEFEADSGGNGGCRVRLVLPLAGSAAGG